MPSLGVYIQYHDLIACLASTGYQNTIQSSLRLNLIQQRSSETEQRFNYTTPLTKNVNNSMIPRLEQDFPSLFIFPKRALKCNTFKHTLPVSFILHQSRKTSHLVDRWSVSNVSAQKHSVRLSPYRFSCHAVHLVNAHRASEKVDTVS